MATFHINRGGTNLGTFSEDEVRGGLRSGKFFGTDLGWREGMATWEPLAQISEFAQEAGSGGAASPQPQFTGASTITPTAPIAPRSGLPWDDRQQRGILRAFFDTLTMVWTQPFETTFRVVCFAGGSANPLLVIPICGGLIAGIWKIVLYCIGFAHAHETDTGRAVLAVVLPVIVCCGSAIVLGMMLGLGAFGFPHH